MNKRYYDSFLPCKHDDAPFSLLCNLSTPDKVARIERGDILLHDLPIFLTESG